MTEELEKYKQGYEEGFEDALYAAGKEIEDLLDYVSIVMKNVRELEPDVPYIKEE